MLKMQQILLGALSLASLFILAEGVVTQAISSDLFADSVCINTHFGFTGLPDYTNTSAVVKLLVEAGILNVREDYIPAFPILINNNIKVNYMGMNELPWWTDSNATVTAKLIAILKNQTQHGLIYDAILGTNEPNGFWPRNNITYNGQAFPGGVVDYMRDMYTQIRADPIFDSKWIIGAPLSNGNDLVLPTNCCAQWVDFADMHPYAFYGASVPTGAEGPYDTISHYYAHSNQPTVQLDPYITAIYSDPMNYYPNRPFFASETGYPTNNGTGTTHDGTSLRAQGLYATRIYAEFFRIGIRRTCIYEMMDGHNDIGYDEDNFGIVHYNFVPKPAYTAIKNLMAIVRSGWVPTASQPQPSSYPLSSIDLTINVSATGSYNRTSYVHHLLLQKPTGEFLLLIWHDISVEDISVFPHRQIDPPLMPTLVTIPPNFNVTIYAPNDGPGPSSAYSTNGTSTFVGETQLSLGIPPHVIVLVMYDMSSTSDASTLAGWINYFYFWVE